MQWQRHQKDSAAALTISHRQSTLVCCDDFFGDCEPQAVVAFFLSCGRRIAVYTVKAVKNFRLFFVGNAGPVILYADGNLFFTYDIGNEESDTASLRGVGESVVQKNMTHLSYS